MALEVRKQCKYYYRSRRINGRVVKEYVGAGPAAESAAQLDREARVQRRRQRDQELQQLLALAALAKQVDRTIEKSELVLAATLLAADYRQHRGEWRRKRDDRTQ